MSLVETCVLWGTPLIHWQAGLYTCCVLRLRVLPDRCLLPGSLAGLGLEGEGPL